MLEELTLALALGGLGAIIGVDLYVRTASSSAGGRGGGANLR